MEGEIKIFRTAVILLIAALTMSGCGRVTELVNRAGSAERISVAITAAISLVLGIPDPR